MEVSISDIIEWEKEIAIACGIPESFLVGEISFPFLTENDVESYFNK